MAQNKQYSELEKRVKILSVNQEGVIEADYISYYDRDSKDILWAFYNEKWEHEGKAYLMLIPENECAELELYEYISGLNDSSPMVYLREVTSDSLLKDVLLKGKCVERHDLIEQNEFEEQLRLYFKTGYDPS